MLTFETVLTNVDDVAVLAAYAAAEEEADLARRDQKAAERAEHQRANAAVAENMPSAESDTGEATLEFDGPEEADPEADAESASENAGRTAIWISRLRTIERVAGDRMAPAHGRLIAHGLLQFQLLSQTSGVVYRLTPAGRQALAAAEAKAANVTDAA